MLESEKAFELYKAFRADNASWLSLHRQYSQQYVTLITAVFVACLGALYQFRDSPWLMLAVLIGPIVNVLLCFNAIAVCDRYYRQFLECVTIQAKLEPLFGLHEERKDISKAEHKSVPFSEDDQILPIRWIESRKQPQATFFVEDNMYLGVNRLVRLTLRILILLNVVLFLGILIGTGVTFQSVP